MSTVYTHGLIDEPTLRAILALRATPEFNLFLKGLVKRRESLHEFIEDTNDAALAQKFSGGAAEISEIMRTVANADEMLDRILKQRK